MDEREQVIVNRIKEFIPLSAANWQAERNAYHARMLPYTEDRIRRMRVGQKHPVYDFLFEYYSFRPAHLLRWTPGFGVHLEGAAPADVEWREFEAYDGGIVLRLGKFPGERLNYLDWAIDYMSKTSQAEPRFNCFGLHEWAMVYRTASVRHERVPLRLSHREIDAIIEGQSLKCTHYDAYRFFTPEAVPRNRFSLNRAETAQFDQSGCVHVNMDLYRICYKIAPFCPSTLMADAFELALAARVLDMRASPYDLSAFGFEPIEIESREGRELYVAHQKELCERSAPIREKLIAVYRQMLEGMNR